MRNSNNLIESNGKLFVAGDLTTAVLKAIQKGGPAGVTYDKLEAKTPLGRKEVYVYVSRLKKNGLVVVHPATRKVNHVIITIKDADTEFRKMRRIN